MVNDTIYMEDPPARKVIPVENVVMIVGTFVYVKVILAVDDVVIASV